ncbi:TonB-dependent receptor [Flavobacterium jejuense]|uniref:TonB-dependent receptor n=1 Tax=Flavobacterium jejuense TaxID=1544455 RepID=A0ABX0IME0_9FLAO|nr:outer membrane beta-barrel family protein [Flavobacterium jejuense]NHN24977.1 TonB-dependent receptor [Flavobacterium jejuense]
MYYKIRIVFFTTFLVLGIKSIAQNKWVTISGTIMDKEKNSLPYVNVTLENKADATFISGTITNENGIFSMKGITKGDYILKCSYLGFTTNETPIYVGEVSDYLDVGKIILQEDITSLKGVEVTYKADDINDKMDKKSFTVSDNISQSGGSVLQMMQNLPGVSVQEGKISLRGNDKVVILIDGKQTALTGFGNQSGLDNLAASSIEKIEIINNPSSKFDANGNAGIINIIYKKNKTDGLTGKAGLTSGLGSLWIRKENLPTIRPQYTTTPKINPSLNLNYKKNKINVFFNADYLYTETLNKNEFVTRTYTDGTIINQQTKRNRNTHFLTLKSGIDWEINERNNFTFSTVYGLEKIIDNGDEPFFNADFSQRLRLWQFLEDEVKTTFMTSTSYEHKFREIGSSLTVNFNFTFHREDEKYFFDNILSSGTSKDAFKLLSDEKVSDLNVDYIKPLKHGKLESGLKLRYREIPTNMQFFPGSNSVIDANAGGKATYKEIIPAIYSNYNYENNKIQAELGLRIEYVNLNYYVNPNHPTYKSDGYNYFQPFPNLRFSYKINKDNKISIFYNRRVDRPNEVDIRIFPKYDDAEIIKVGNPALKPQYTNTIEMGYKKNYNKGYFYAALYHKMIDATITRIATTDSNSTILYNVFQNVGKSSNTGVEFIFNNKVNDWYTYNLNTNFYYNQINAFSIINLYPNPSVYASDTQTLFSGNIKWNNIFKFNKNYSGQISSYYLAPEIIPQGKLKSRYSVDLGIKKMIQNGKGELFFNATDIFNTLVLRSTINGANFNYTSNNYAETQVIRLGYNYKF